VYHAFESQCVQSTELQSYRAAEQQSSRAAEQQSSRAAEQQEQRAAEGKFLFTLLAVVFMSFFTNFSLWGEILFRKNSSKLWILK